MDRHGLRPRDDRGGIFTMKGEVVEFSYCHCEEDRMDDAAIHRVLGDVGGNCGLLTFPLSLLPLNLHSSIDWFTVDRHGL